MFTQCTKTHGLNIETGTRVVPCDQRDSLWNAHIFPSLQRPIHQSILPFQLERQELQLPNAMLGKLLGVIQAWLISRAGLCSSCAWGEPPPLSQIPRMSIKPRLPLTASEVSSPWGRLSRGRQVLRHRSLQKQVPVLFSKFKVFLWLQPRRGSRESDKKRH